MKVNFPIQAKKEIPLIILHGWGASSKSFAKVKELLEQKGVSVFVLDLPGFRSVAPSDKAWSVDDYADWVENYIENKIHPALPLKKEGEKSFVLYGHSFGGRIGIKLAARQIEGLKGLILCDAAGITPRPKIKINIFSLLSRTGKLFFSLPILKYFQPIVRKIEYFLAGTRDYYYLQSEIMKGTFKKVIEEDLTSYLGKISVPTLIIWGKKDKMTPVSDAYVMNRKIAGSKLEILENVGHSPHLESPEELANIVTNFVKQQ